MKVTLHNGSGVHPARVPYPGADHVEVPCQNCPACGAPLKAAGRKGTSRHDRDTHYAQAGSLCCNAHVGELRARVDTFFGIEEDERVLAGPWKVY